MLRLAIAFISVAALSACAKRPGEIAAVAMPPGSYSGMSCQTLAQSYSVEAARLAGLASAQDGAATGDAIGVFLIGIPTASLAGGDKEAEIAVSKGKIEALRNAADAKRCALPA